MRPLRAAGAPLVGLALLATLSACGGGEPHAVDRVLHLDPRLADGRSPTVALLAGPPPLATRFDGKADGPFVLVDEPGRRALQLKGPVDAATHAWLEVQADAQGELPFHATWRAGTELFELAGALVPNHVGALTLALDAEPGWKGEIRDLTLRFSTKKPVQILSAKLASSAFTAGFEPLGEGAADPERDRGDMGLVAFGETCRRAWPAELGVPLFATVEVPRAGRLALQVSPLVPRDVVCTVAGRAGGGTFEPLGELVVRGPGWRPLEVDLAQHAGEELELRFLAARQGDAEPAEPRELTRADVLFGEPVVTGERPKAARPNIVLITLDTTRGDVLGLGFTPNLEALIGRGTRFDAAFATTNSTIPSHASIFTGLQLEEHGAIGNRHAFGTENVTLAERLRAGGYNTAAAVSVSLLRPGFGFGQGFDRFELPHENAFRDGTPATEAALSWLEGWSADGAPFFLWLHLFDAHTPYGPPKDFVDAFLAQHDLELPPEEVNPPTMPVWDEPPAQLSFLKGESNLERVVFEYHLGVAHADALVGRVAAKLAELGLSDNTLLVVTADHGESLGERDYWFEHGNLYPEVLHVPLILAGPGVPAGAAVGEEVSLIDVYPTVLAAAGQRADKVEGIDLRKLASAGTAEARTLWFQLSDRRQTGFRDGRVHFVATLENGLRWISGSERNAEGLRVPHFASEDAGVSHLFDLSADPGALLDVAGERPDQAAGLTLDVKGWLAARAKAQAERRGLTEEEEQELQNLGYTGDH